MSNNNKTFATAVLASVAIVMTITALALVSPQSSWDGALLTDSGLDSFVVTTAAIPNSPDAWSAFDAVSDAMSSDWLIPLAFADITSIKVNDIAFDGINYINVTTPEETFTTISVIAISNVTITYVWNWNGEDEPADLQGLNTSAITFTAPTVDEESVYFLTIYVDDVDEYNTVDLNLIVLDAGNTTNNPPMVYAGPDLSAVIKGQVIHLSEATATDDNGDALTYAWTATPSSAVTFNSTTALNPEVTVSNTVTDDDIIELTLTVNDGTVDASDTRRLTIQDAVVTNIAPTVNAGPDLSAVIKGQVIHLSEATATDDNGDALTYAWTATPSSAVTFNSTTALNPEVTVSNTVTDDDIIELTLTVNDGTVDASDTRRLTIQDAVVTNIAPTVNAGPDLSAVIKGQVIHLSEATATDDNGDALTYAWTATPSSAVTFNSTTALNPEVTVSNTVTDDDIIELTLTVNDGTVDASDTRRLTIQDAVVTNIAPTVNAGPDLSAVIKGQVIHLSEATATDDNGDALTYAWTATPSSAVTFNSTTALNPEVTVSNTVTDGDIIELTLTVNDGTVDASDTRRLTIQDAVVTNTAPTIDNISGAITVKERTSVTLTATASDPNIGDTLTYLWDDSDLPTGTVATGDTTKSLKFTAPGISSGTETFEFTLTVTDQGGLTATSNTVTVTVEDVPLKVSSVTYNPGNGQLKIIFNQNINSLIYGSMDIRSADPNSNKVLLSAVDVEHARAVITATLNSTQKEAYADLTSPQLNIASGAVTDDDGITIAEMSEPITTISKKKSSSSSSAPIVDLNRLVQARIVDIPSVISELVSSHNADDPLEPILDNNTFDFPLTINDYYYLLDDTTNTLIPRTVTAGQSTEIKFTVYTDEDLAYFILYLNMQGSDVNYSGTDTHIRYTNDGTVTVIDPHGYIANAKITVTQEDNSMPEKKTVTITIEFDEPMGLTNMVAYMWNTDRRAAIVNLIDAIDVTAAAQTRQNSASTDGSSGSAKVNSEPDVSDDDRSDGQNSQSVTKSGIVVIGSNADDAQTLSLIRMWSGFASESITDAELLESMGLDNYPVVHIPDWVMTELGALVSNNDVTVEEFRTALVYMLEMLTA